MIVQPDDRSVGLNEVILGIIVIEFQEQKQRRKKMQRGKRFLSLLLAMVMLLGMAMPAMADEADVKTEKVTLHKLLMSEENLNQKDSEGNNIFPGTTGLDGTEYDGNKIDNITAYFGEGSTEIEKVYFAWQAKDTSGEWKYIKEDGTTIETDPTPITKEAFVNAGVFGKETTGNGAEFNTSGLKQDAAGTEYRIVEVKELSTYVGADGETLSRMLAVPVEITLPLVNQDGIQEEVHVYPKNTEVGKPDNEKTFGDDASDEIKEGKVDVGETVPYKVTTTIEAGSTYNKLAWTDKMSAGLTFNQDVVITSNPDLALTEGTDYTINYADPTGFVLVLTNSGLAKLAAQTAPTDAGFKVNGEGDEINGLNTAVTFTLEYSAVVNEDAVINNPLENTNSLHYGNNPGYTPEPGDNNPPEIPNVTEITVNKSFTNGPTAADDEITWPAGVEIHLTLQVYNPSTNEWEDIQATTLNAGKTSHTFEDLDDTKVYKVVESDVNGWVPNYELQADGTLKIVNKKNDNPEPITPDPVIVRTGGKKFVKTSLVATERLAGAKFVVIDEAGQYLALKSDAQTGTEIADYNAAEEAYQAAVAEANAILAEAERTPEQTERLAMLQGNDTVTGSIAQLKVARDTAYEGMNMQWTWVANEGDAFVFTTNEEGQWSVEGLAYGSYKFKEIEAPTGYADQLTPVDFTIDANSYTTGNIAYEVGRDEDATRITNQKVTIPQTGGVGTVIFTVAGIALMGGAAVAMKKRGEEDEE